MPKTESQQNAALLEILRNTPRGFLPFFRKKLDSFQLATEVSKLLYPDNKDMPANVNFEGKDKKSFLMIASSFSEKEYGEVIKILLKHNMINPDLSRDPTDHRTAFMINVENGNLENVKNFLDADIIPQNKINVNLVDANRKSALMIAAEKGDLEMVKILIERRLSDLNFMLTDKNGKTALELCKLDLNVPEKIRQEIGALIVDGIQKQITNT